MHRDEVKEVVDWTLAYEDSLDWAAPSWEDPLEDRAMAVLQHEAIENCHKEVLANRQCLEVRTPPRSRANSSRPRTCSTSASRATPRR